MAAKRNYKAEYARRKALAKEAGYASEREYKAARSTAQAWSREFSRKTESAYTPRLTNTQVAAYNKAFTQNAELHARGEAWSYRERHTISWLHENYPDTYPDEYDVEYWDSYFED